MVVYRCYRSYCSRHADALDIELDGSSTPSCQPGTLSPSHPATSTFTTSSNPYHWDHHSGDCIHHHHQHRYNEILEGRMYKTRGEPALSIKRAVWFETGCEHQDQYLATKELHSMPPKAIEKITLPASCGS